MSIRTLLYLKDIDNKKHFDKKHYLLVNYLNKLNKDKYETLDDLDDLDMYKFKGDFFSYLMTLDIPIYMHVPTMFLNDISNSEDFSGKLEVLRIFTSNVYTDIQKFLENIEENKL